MDTRATTIKCVHFGYDALIDMFQYENNSYELKTRVVLIFKRHKSFCGGIVGIKDETNMDRSFGIKWHNMTKPSMNDWPMKGTVRFVEM